MKNAYEIRGDVTAIFLNRKDGSTLEALIDTEDLPKLQAYTKTWYAAIRRRTIYAAINLPWKNNKPTGNILMHRVILSDIEELDHFDSNGLNNRKYNLRDLTHSENCQNLRSHVDSKSKVRGVSWFKRDSKWHAQICVEGKRIHIGYFNDLQDAETAITKARAVLMPYSKEGSQ